MSNTTELVTKEASRLRHAIRGITAIWDQAEAMRMLVVAQDDLELSRYLGGIVVNAEDALDHLKTRLRVVNLRAVELGLVREVSR